MDGSVLNSMLELMQQQLETQQQVLQTQSAAVDLQMSILSKLTNALDGGKGHLRVETVELPPSNAQAPAAGVPERSKPGIADVWEKQSNAMLTKIRTTVSNKERERDNKFQ